MTVAELIEVLKTYDQSLPVVYQIYSEYALMENVDVSIKDLQVARIDGWVHGARPDKPSIKYLVFPGN